MAKIKYFNGENELTALQPMKNAEFAARFPGVKGKKYDGYSMFVGRPVNVEPKFIQGEGWDRSTLVAVERVIEYKSNPSKHICDARCVNATGKIMKCECSCGGKNHGRGSSMICEAA